MNHVSSHRTGAVAMTVLLGAATGITITASSASASVTHVPITASASASASPTVTAMAARSGNCPWVGDAQRLGGVDWPVVENSYLVAARNGDGNLLWAGNDSGDGNRIFAIRKDGSVRAQYYLSGARAYDWEDMSSGWGPDGRSLFVSDTGDNALARGDVQIYRFREPTDVPDWSGMATETIPDGAVDTIHVRYTNPWGSSTRMDVEAMTIDRNGDAYFFGKRLRDGVNGRNRQSPVYVARGLAGAGDGAWLTAHQIGWVRGNPYDSGSSWAPSGWNTGPTAADISADGHWMVVRTYASASFWYRGDTGDPFSDALLADNDGTCMVTDQGSLPAGEAIAFSPDGTTIFGLPEGGGASVTRTGFAGW